MMMISDSGNHLPKNGRTISLLTGLCKKFCGRRQMRTNMNIFLITFYSKTVKICLSLFLINKLLDSILVKKLGHIQIVQMTCTYIYTCRVLVQLNSLT